MLFRATLCSMMGLWLTVQAAEISTGEPGNLFDESQGVVLHLRSGAGEVPDQLDWICWAEPGSGGTTGSLNAEELRALADGFDLRLQMPTGLWKFETQETYGKDQKRSHFSFAVTPSPAPVSANVEPYWGLMIVPYDGPADEEQSRRLALNIRRLGAQWVRLTFWEHAYEKIELQPDRVSVQMDKYLSIARALKREEIQIMGEFCQIPRQLSSRPDDNQSNVSDAGPLYSRVKPADYRQWDPFVQAVVRQFRGLIGWYEIGNEPNIGGCYWAGSAAEFSEFVKHTATSIKAADPEAGVVISGFTRSEADRENSVEFLSFLLKDGVGKYIDVFSSHSWNPKHIELLKQYGKDDVPRWDTESHALFNFHVLKGGYTRIAHFIHSHASQALQGHDVLVNLDLTPRKQAIVYAVGAKVLGNVKYVADRTNAKSEVFVLRRECGDLAVTTKNILSDSVRPGIARIRVEPMAAGAAEMTAFDWMGRSYTLPIQDGIVELPIRNFDILTGAKRAEIVEVIDAQSPPEPEQYYFDARKSGIVADGSWGPNNTWTAVPAPDSGHAAALEIEVPRDDEYEIYFDGTVTYRLQGDRTISPFVWSIDGGGLHLVDGILPAIWKRNGGYGARANAPIPAAEMMYASGKDLWQKLGVVKLNAGRHSFRLELVDRRKSPDNAFCLEFDGLLLRPVVKESFGKALAAESALPADAVEIPLFNGDFETVPQPNPRMEIPGWKRTNDFTYVAAYNPASSPNSLLTFPGTGVKMKVGQMIPAAKLELLCGRKLLPGDKLVVEADVRYYWEEGGAEPELAAIGIGRSDDGALESPVKFNRVESLSRENRRVRAEYTVRAEDGSNAGYWCVILRNDVAPDRPGGPVSWDNVKLYLLPRTGKP